mmetsp:Transcript_7593/g.16419  ORF Transcript_7593/g.16419 Transcript_7593/m.16419 type:complete len:539 (-) Transcript_7593:45-1661(-)
MDQGENVNDDDTRNNNTISDNAPFEWLTNFKSLRHLVLPSCIVFGPSPSSPESSNDDTANASSTATTTRATSHQGSEQQSNNNNIQLNALHVGCGTSTLGESLLSLREHTRNCSLQYGRVVNVDNDKNALESMQRRWEKRKPPTQGDGDNNNNNDNNTYQSGEKQCYGTMEWKCLDFKEDESCRTALDGAYRELLQHDNNEAFSTDDDDDPSGGCFDLVLDKSTLDCLLCAETNVVAQLLYEVYRALRVPTTSTSENNNPSTIDNTTSQSTAALPPPSSSWGGVYVLVTFHPPEFVERLLTQLPGANWHVEYEVIKREVDDVNEDGVWVIDEVVACGSKDDTTTTTAPTTNNEKEVMLPSSSAWSSGTFHPDENYRKTVTVFTCRRLCCTQTQDEGGTTTTTSPSLPTYILDREQVRGHIARTCDDWYQTTNPMVTSEREGQLRVSFLEAANAVKRNVTRSETTGGDGESVSDKGVVLELKQCYETIFTDAEKEHLTYEYFLEDWDAYCERVDKDADNIHPRDGMTVAVAIDFLKEMQ